MVLRLFEGGARMWMGQGKYILLGIRKITNYFPNISHFRYLQFCKFSINKTNILYNSFVYNRTQYVITFPNVTRWRSVFPLCQRAYSQKRPPTHSMKRCYTTDHHMIRALEVPFPKECSMCSIGRFTLLLQAYGFLKNLQGGLVFAKFLLQLTN